MSGDQVRKSAVKLFLILNLIGPYSGLLNEILWIFVAQGTAKLPEVKVEDTKNARIQTWPHSIRDERRIIFHTSKFVFSSFAVSWAIRINRISFKSLDMGVIGY